ncbi:MAG: 23S rRNA (adenine(1618)-N(6))-methyltransferase RlmF [Flavobacteriales bacterium]|nr:23S rRNA (adenine(1618)-N(6))-methyltransferase RlmF [Flavobacteriales bacterium]MCB9363756.1 23S rRNA (adenine(1618)-N(6))-methyltransferase RlmF [Flavobacteriales bacterium]
MKPVKKEFSKEKTRLHPRSKHKERYDFNVLVKKNKALSAFVRINEYGDESIDFANPEAVRELNKSLLLFHYNLDYWDIPEGFLCPPIPGRADYIHYVADLLGNSNYGKIPKGKSVKCLDIGTGASCIYPIIGVAEYGWSFIGSDINKTSLASSQQIIEGNSFLTNNIELRLQETPSDIIYGVLTKDEIVDLMICNPPFHGSEEASKKGTLKKLNNLNDKQTKTAVLNFGGQQNELWCKGGEKKFVGDYIRQSKNFANNCFWFTSLISKKDNLKSIYDALKKANAVEVKTIPMGQGNKTSRIVAWTFLTPEQQKEWRDNKWKTTL